MAHAGMLAKKKVATTNAAGWMRERMSKKFMKQPDKGQRQDVC
jgi:hypothetical protein